MHRRIAVAFALTLASACERPQPGAAVAPAPAPSPGPTPTGTGPGAPTPQPSAGAAQTNGACEGAELSLLAAIASPSCRISEDEADALRSVLEDPAKAPLKVDATALPDGRVKIRVTNTGSAPQALPLLVHSHLDNFAVRVDEKELAAPDPDWPPGFAFETGRMLAKIVLPPGGTADATLRINPNRVSHEIRNCPPNAKCAPATVQHGALPRGTHNLKIRTPLYSIRSDLEASLAWTMP